MNRFITDIGFYFQATLIYTSDELLSKIVTIINRCPLVKTVVFMDQKIFKERNSTEMQELKTKMKNKFPSNVVLMELSKLEEIGANDHDNVLEKMTNKPTKDSLAIIMYTSGSTGMPKGVEITQGNIVASMAGMKGVLPVFNVEDEVYISYLPLAHVMELVCELLLVTMGIKLGYSRWDWRILMGGDVIGR